MRFSKTPKEKASIQAVALRYLSRREHSAYELSEKLREKGFTEVEIEALIDEFQVNGWQCNQRFTESIIRVRIAQGKGLALIQNELREHRIDAEIVKICLNSANIDWIDLARDVLIKRFGDLAFESAQDQSQAYRFLLTRGFLPEQIRSALAWGKS